MRRLPLLATLLASIATAEMATYPQPIIIFNYGTYQAGPSGPSLMPTMPVTPPPSTPALPAAPSTEVSIAPVAPPAKDYTNGLGLGLHFSVADGSAKGIVGGADLDLRFLTYLGLEVQALTKLGGGSGKFTHLLAGPKIQLPLKSWLINFTPTVGVGYSLFEIGSQKSSGLAAYARAEVELFGILVAQGTFTTASDKGRGEYVFDAREYYGSHDNYGGGSYQASGAYQSLALRAGIRFRPDVVLSAEYSERTFGQATKMKSTGVMLDLLF